MSVVQEIKNVFIRSGQNSGLYRIILLNVFVFLVVNITDNILSLADVQFSLSQLLVLPSRFTDALIRFWTIISYMFLHRELFHILFNMLWLYWLGKIFAEYLGSRRLVGVYLLGGLAGGVLYLVGAALAPSSFLWGSGLLGASAGVMAVIVAIAVLLPEYVIHLLFFGGVRLKYVALAAFVLTTLIDFADNTGGKVAHIGGALLGWFFILRYKRGQDITLPLLNVWDAGLKFFSARKSPVRVIYRKRTTSKEYHSLHNERQEKIDRILDKISKSGYESLTKEEKDFLFKASERE